jgi:hypothetical protein
VYDLGDPYARWRRFYAEEIYADKGIDAGSNRITNVAAPVGYYDAATKGYVDDAVGSGTTSWSGINDKPTWVDKVSYDDIGQYMDPARPSNYDIIVSDSITPSAVSAFNIGQDLRRFMFGYFERVRISATSPHNEDEAVPYKFMREYVEANAMWSTWSGIRGRPSWTDFMTSGGTTDTLFPNGDSIYDLGDTSTRWRNMYTKHISASSVIKTTLIEADSLIVKNYASFNGNRLESVGEPTSDDDAATKKFVDDTDTATRTYVDDKDAAMSSRVSGVVSSLQFELLPSINSPIVTHLTTEVVNYASYGTLRLRNMEMIVPTVSSPADVSPRIIVTLYKQPLEIGQSAWIESSSSAQVKFGQLHFEFPNKDITFTYSQGYATSPLVRITVTRVVPFYSVNMITNVTHRLKGQQAGVEKIWL